MAFSLDSSSRKLIDFFYNRAELVSRASFEVAMASVSLPCLSWFNLTFSGQRIEVEKCPTGAKLFLCSCKESRR